MEINGIPGNPWLRIWVRPRETIRAYLNSERPRRGMLWLAAAAGYINALGTASARSAGDTANSMADIYIAALGGILGGLLTLYLGSWLVKVTGRWLGGEGTFSDLQTAIARGSFMPSILAGLLWIPQLLLFGSEMFSTETPRIDASSGLTAIFYLFMAVEIVLLVWMIIIGVKAVGEAHRFSAWKALGSVLLAILLVIAAAVVVGIFISML